MAEQKDSDDDLLSVTRELLDEYRKQSELTVGMSRVVRDTEQVVRDIHILVNSEKTAGLERELTTQRTLLELLKELGRPARVIASTEKAIAELEKTLAERAKAQARVDGA